jgi:hypothetical protein
MILTSVLLCDRKAHSQLEAVPRLGELTYPDTVLYLNVETEDFDAHFSGLKAWLQTCKLPYHLDTWTWTSTWFKKPQYDQDQARLTPIVMARNMCIEAAMRLGATHLFQVDADVLVPKHSIERLLELKWPICGGIVPGRGVHSHVKYIFGEQRPIEPDVIEVGYGTAGFCLIERRVFQWLRYRWGPSSYDSKVMLSEDPAYAEDAHLVWSFGRWRLATDLVAEHHDNPGDPLTESGVAPW